MRLLCDGPIVLLMKYYKETQMELALSPVLTRAKQAIGATAVLLFSLVGLGIAREMGMGTSALILQDRNYQAFQLATTLDLRNIKQFILKLETSLDSLAEFVLPSQRSLTSSLCNKEDYVLPWGKNVVLCQSFQGN